MPKTPIGQLRTIAMFEGLSFIVLLGVAMPLKYLWDYPLAVRIVGMVHGVLFLSLCGVLFNVKQMTEWKMRRVASVLIAALLPFGPFVIDGSLRREDDALQAVRHHPGRDVGFVSPEDSHAATKAAPKV